MIDFHARLAPGLLAAMDEAGITRAAVSAGGLVTLDRLSELIVAPGPPGPRADNAAVLAAASDRLLPLFFADPSSDDVTRYTKVAAAYRGLEISPAVHGCRFDDPGVLELVAVAAAHQHPVYTVCLARPGTTAADLVRLASRFPSVVFVFGHCGFTGLDASGLATIAPHPGIHAELSGCFTAVARLALERLGPSRVLFGTEFPLQHPAVEVAKIAALGLPDDVWHLVTRRNAARLLGEDT